MYVRFRCFFCWYFLFHQIVQIQLHPGTGLLLAIKVWNVSPLETRAFSDNSRERGSVTRITQILVVWHDVRNVGIPWVFVHVIHVSQIVQKAVWIVTWRTKEMRRTESTMLITRSSNTLNKKTNDIQCKSLYTFGWVSIWKLIII